ncbi:MAG: hypothetical protein ACE5E5_07095 [Phycisphaerae bacterium]
MVRFAAPLHLVSFIMPLSLCGLLGANPARGADPPSVVKHTASKQEHQSKTVARARVSVEHSVTVVRHDVKRSTGNRAPRPRYETVEVVEVVEEVDADRTPPRPAPPVAQFGRAARQVRTPRSWSVHGNPAWSYHPPALRYQPKLRKPYKPRRDWSYHPAASAKYKPKRGRAYHRK